jgi:hypothetical protein
MHVSGQVMDAEAQKKAQEEAQHGKKIGLSPAALKRKLAAKKAAAKAEKAAKKAGSVNVGAGSEVQGLPPRERRADDLLPEGRAGR